MFFELQWGVGGVLWYGWGGMVVWVVRMDSRGMGGVKKGIALVVVGMVEGLGVWEKET